MTEQKNNERLVVYTIIQNRNETKDSFWQRIGTAFKNRDGSLTVRLNALPVNGTLHIRQSQNKEADATY